MRASIDWETVYRYDEPVRQLHGELQALPADADGQVLGGWTLTVTPEAELEESRDAFGNIVHRFDLLRPLQELTIRLRAEVETPSDHAGSTGVAPLLAHLYTHPTARCPDDPRIRALAGEIQIDAATDPLAYAAAFMTMLHDRFIFEVGHTDVEDTAVDLIELGHGVCQDFSHLMIAALRSKGLLARYVSGYLAPERDTVTGEATHAWMQVFANGAWHGFDPSNNVRQGERYVVISVGRDYDDVPPMRGSFRGAAEQVWRSTIIVQVHPEQAQQQKQQ